MVVGSTTIPTIFHAVDVVTLMPLDGLVWPVISHLPHATATATTGQAKPGCPEELLGPHTVVLQLGNDAGNPQVYFLTPLPVSMWWLCGCHCPDKYRRALHLHWQQGRGWWPESPRKNQFLAV